MNINDVTVSWQDMSDTERMALLNKPCPPRRKPNIHPIRKTPDRITSRVFSICQSAAMNNHTAQRPIRLNQPKSYTTLTSSKENVDNAYRTMIEFTETCKRESANDGNPTDMPISKRVRSSSPTTIVEQCPSPTAISRFISHDSYLTFVPPPPSDKLATTTTTLVSSNHTQDDVDDAIWDDWDLPPATQTQTKKSSTTPGKIRTMSSPAVHSRAITTTIVAAPSIAMAVQSPMESTPVPSAVSNIVWDDDDDDFDALLSQFPSELPFEQPAIENDSLLTKTTIDDDNATRLDATRRSSAIRMKDNESIIDLSTQPSQNQVRSSTSLQRSITGPLPAFVVQTTTTPRVRCDSASTTNKKPPCTAAEIEQKRLAALAIRRQRELEQQKKH